MVLILEIRNILIAVLLLYILGKHLNLSEIDGIELGLRKKINIWSPAMDNLDKSKLLLIGYELLGDKLFQIMELLLWK